MRAKSCRYLLRLSNKNKVTVFYFYLKNKHKLDKGALKWFLNQIKKKVMLDSDNGYTVSIPLNDTKIDEVFIVTDTREMFIIPIEEIKNKTTLNLCEKYEKNRVKI